MDNLETLITDLKDDLKKVIEKYEKEHGLFIVKIKYNCFDRRIKMDCAAGNVKIINQENGRNEEM